MLEPRLVINECYILQEKLGEDSFCELWRATSIYAATEFLLRFIKEREGLADRMGAFRASAMDCYSIGAPAVQDFVEVEREAERYFIASEYGGQRNLLDAYGGSPRIRLEYACRFIIELGQGLDAFHKRGLVYRCLNAENVLVTRSGDHIETIRVQKPGYAPFLPLLGEGDGKAAMESFSYMAPEAKAGGTVDRRADIYSLGVHLFRFLTGKLPYSTIRRARSGSVSLDYAARAFTRRGVPEPVARTALKALRRDPGLRHGEALELIAELRVFVDERRRELLARGEVDPLAELATLNLAKDRVDATQAVKSLDTADYFRSIAETPRGPESVEQALLFPVQDFAQAAEVDRLEATEAEGAEDDSSLSPDDYLARAYKAVSGETVSRRPGVTLIAPAGPAPKPRKVPEETAGPKAAVPAAPVPPATPAVAASSVAPPSQAVAEPTPLPVGAFASDPPSRRRRKQGLPENVDAGGVSWRPDAAPPDAVVAGMESAFARAFKGAGAFRFIQEPTPGPGAVAFARVFARFRARGLVADLGTLPAGADATDLLRALRASLAAGLSYEAVQAQSVLARRLGALDSYGAFKAAPLGTLLYGKDGPEPDPEWLESTEGSMRVALCIAALGRRRRPLVLTMRGGEAIGRSAHAILVELARLAPIATFCCFVFYVPARVPSWHVLSKLAVPSQGH
jgi:serine/threonine protein kinase